MKIFKIQYIVVLYMLILHFTFVKRLNNELLIIKVLAKICVKKL